MITEIREKFLEKFGVSPLLVRAPGRLNLIGEHTDYNMGYVLPAAIDREMTFALASSQNEEITLHALDIDEEIRIKLSELKPSKDPMWPNYLLGVVAEMREKGHHVEGFYCMFGGNIPIGAGLSSSAAIECGLAVGLNELFQQGISREELIGIAQKAEHHYTGVMCGIMDQFASTYGKEGHVIRLDCRSLEHEYFPLDTSGLSIVLLDTVVHHSLASSEYNTRRQECEEGVRIIAKNYPEVASLRDCTPEMVVENREALGETIYNRCLYITEENKRVEQACEKLLAGDMEGMGKLMNFSHDGLSRLYEVSCDELDFLQEHAIGKKGVLGARMMGGGFGGCTINLVRSEIVDDFVGSAKNAYFQRFNLQLKSYVVSIANGVSVVS